MNTINLIIYVKNKEYKNGLNSLKLNNSIINDIIIEIEIKIDSSFVENYTIFFNYKNKLINFNIYEKIDENLIKQSILNGIYNFIIDNYTE